MTLALVAVAACSPPRASSSTGCVNSGKAVCQVDNEPKQFSECFPQNQPYWALFVETRGAWTSSAGGFTDARLHDTEALGWHYVPSTDPSPGPPPLAEQLPAAGS